MGIAWEQGSVVLWPTVGEVCEGKCLRQVAGPSGSSWFLRCYLPLHVDTCKPRLVTHGAHIQQYVVWPAHVVREAAAVLPIPPSVSFQHAHM